MYPKHTFWIWSEKYIKRSGESYAYQYALADITTEVLNAILASTKEDVTGMDTMVSWFIPIIDALGSMEDVIHRMGEVNGIDDSAVMVSITPYRPCAGLVLRSSKFIRPLQ